MSCVQTQTVGPLQMDTMARFDPQKNSRTKAAASFVPNSAKFANGMANFSLQTEPSQGQDSGSFWNGTGEGQQYLHQDLSSPLGHSHNGFPDSFPSFQVSQDSQAGNNHGRGSFSGSTQGQWKSEISSPHLGPEEMSRQDSIGAISQRTTHSLTANSYDQSRSASLCPNVSQMPFHMSSARSDITGRSNSPENADFYTSTPQMELPDFENFPFQGEVELSGNHPFFHRDSNAGIASHTDVPSTSGESYNVYSTTGDDIFLSLNTDSNPISNQGTVSTESMGYNPSTLTGSPALWDGNTDFMDSQRSSPTLLEDRWAAPPPQMMTPATDHPLEYSPTLDGLSPRYVPQELTEFAELPRFANSGSRVTRKPVGPRQSKVTSDLASRGARPPVTPDTSDDTFKLLGRSSVELDNTARDHPLYHNVRPKSDGLYHCPYEDDPTANCTHKPEKLKCNYDKFVDSHLKPYKCKVSTCKELCFSSTACLLRHEREAHAMHGHGDKPFLCTYEGCERAVLGNGFPRHWNLRDHMKRVHNDPGQPKSSASGSPPPSAPSKGKKRKAVDNTESSFAEKAVKRATPPPATRHLHDSSVIESYQEAQQKLLATIVKVHDPRTAGNMALLINAREYLQVMMTKARYINSASSMGQNFNSNPNE